MNILIYLFHTMKIHLVDKEKRQKPQRKLKFNRLCVCGKDINDVTWFNYLGPPEYSLLH